MNTCDLFDIVIPVGPSDMDIIKKQVEYTKKNIIGYRNIYLVSYDKSLQIDGCETISEEIYPFSIKTVEEIHGKSGRNGWYLQQLLKLYAGKVIPNILETYLVIDSDTFFLKPATFTENGKCLYCFGTEYNEPYFIHMKKLHSSFKKMDEYKSGICHHMIFQTKYINEIFEMVEKEHNGTSFYQTFLKCVMPSIDSGASEYEIYFNYMIQYHPTEIKIRFLSWNNVYTISEDRGHVYESAHCWVRK